MSSPLNPPKFSYFYKEFLREIDAFEKGIKEISNPTLQKQAAVLTQHIHNRFKNMQTSVNDTKKYKTIIIDSVSEINQFAIKILGDSSAYSYALCQQYQEKFDQFKLKINEFKQLSQHINAINQTGLDKFLNEEWAQIAFKKLIQSNDRWAMKILDQLCENDDQFGNEILHGIIEGIGIDDEFNEKLKHLFMKRDYFRLSLFIKNEAFFHKLTSFLIEFMESDFIQSVLQELVSFEHQRLALACLFLKIILKAAPCLWAQQLLIELMYKYVKEAVDVFFQLMLEEQNASSWTFDCLKRSFENNRNWAVTIVYECIFVKPYEMIHPLINSIFINAKQNVEVLHILTSYAALLEEGHPFSDMLSKIYPEILGRLNRARMLNHLLLTFKNDLQENDTLQWSKTHTTYKLNVLRLIIRRDYYLERILLGHLDSAQLSAPVVLKCFPKVNAIFCGAANIAHELEKILAPYPITLYQPNPVEKDIKEMHGSKIRSLLGPDLPMYYPMQEEPTSKRQILPGDQLHSQWAQDALSFHERGIVKVPSIAFISPEDTAAVEGARDQRLTSLFGEDFPTCDFESIGRVDQFLDQLSYLDYLFSRDVELDKSMIGFTYNEGGNCLIGTKNGEPCAIIGRDTIEMNKRLLERELSNMGLFKNAEGVWERDIPFSRETCGLSESDVIQLLAVDLGIKPASIFVIEQVDYHLDMRAAFIDDSTIMLHSAAQSFDLFQDFINYQIDLGQVSEAISARLDERLEQLEENLAEYSGYEDAAESDLRAQGFRVIRTAGIFKNMLENHPSNHHINYFNTLFIRTASIDDPSTDSRSIEIKKIVIALGSEPFFNHRFEEIIREHIPDIHRVYFIKQDLSEKLLIEDGGISCATKLLSEKL